MASVDISKIEKNFEGEDICYEGLKIYNVRESLFKIYGLCKPYENEGFKRMPHDEAEKMNPNIQRLYTNTSGGHIRFQTDSTRIFLRAILPELLRMAHMPKTGSSCFDLYVDGEYYNTFRHGCLIGLESQDKPENAYDFNLTFKERKMRDILINFPLYNSVDDIFIGLDEDAVVLPAEDYNHQTPKSEIESLKLEIKRLQESNPLWGKKYVACGDSFTKGDFSHWRDENGCYKQESSIIYDKEWGMYKTYPWQIGKRNNMTIINEAKCGSILALDKRYVAGEDEITIESRNPFSLERYKQIPEDTDYCTIWFGINDSAYTNLGTIDDTTNETFYGAWNVVLEWLITNRPYMKIGIIVTDADAHPKWRQATRECARKWGIPYLDMMGDVRVPVIMGREPELGLCAKAEELRTKSFVVSDKNGHPNLKAHEYQSYIIENFLRSL